MTCMGHARTQSGLVIMMAAILISFSDPGSQSGGEQQLSRVEHGLLSSKDKAGIFNICCNLVFCTHKVLVLLSSSRSKSI